MGEARAIEAAVTWAEPEQRALAAIRSVGRVLRLRRPPARSRARRLDARRSAGGAWASSSKVPRSPSIAVLACGCSQVRRLLRCGFLG